MSQLAQELMIARVRELSHGDSRLDAVLMYGSFSQGEADQYSDIEFWLYHQPDALIDPENWLADVAPLDLCLINEFGTTVAIFSNLVRGEFHFCSLHHLADMAAWPLRNEQVNIDAMIVLDRQGLLRRQLEDLSHQQSDASKHSIRQNLWDRFINWMLFCDNLLKRGEIARAYQVLDTARAWHLLYLARLAEGKTQHWLTPAKRLEQDISAESYRVFVSTTAALEPQDVRRAFIAAWEWGCLLVAQIPDINRHPELLDKLDRRFRAVDVTSG